MLLLDDPFARAARVLRAEPTRWREVRDLLHTGSPRGTRSAMVGLARVIEAMYPDRVDFRRTAQRPDTFALSYGAIREFAGRSDTSVADVLAVLVAAAGTQPIERAEGLAGHWLLVSDAACLYREIERCLEHYLRAPDDSMSRYRHCTFDIGDVGDPQGPRFVQVATEGTEVLLESVSDRFLVPPSSVRLSNRDRHALRYAGWRAPSELSPNWHRVIDDLPGWPALATDLLGRTLIDAHGWRPGRWVSATLC